MPQFQALSRQLGLLGRTLAFIIVCPLAAHADDSHPPALSDAGNPDASSAGTSVVPLPPPNPPPPVQQEDGKPIFSVYVDGLDKGLKQYEDWLGCPSAAILLYTGDKDWADYQGSIGWGSWQFHKTKHRFLWSVSFMPKKGTTLAVAATGAYNSQWKKAAETVLKSTPDKGLIYVRTAWEFNGNWFHYNAIHKEQDFIGAWRQFVSTFRSVSDRFRFDWCPGGCATLSMKAEDAYPGDDYVDIIGLDVYDGNKWPVINDPVKRWDKVYLHGDHGLEWLKTFAAQHNKAISFPEWGACGNKAGDDPYFVEQMHQWMIDNHVIYASFWNSNSTYGGSLSSGKYPLAAAKYKELFASTDAASMAAPAPAPAAPPAPATAVTPPVASAPPPPPPAPVACTIAQAAPLEAYTADGQMSGVTQSIVGKNYTCLRVESGKAVLRDASGQIFKIRADAISQTPAISSAP